MMNIKTIDIQNYRGIEKLHMEFEEGVNLLIGNNGAGKTSLLNAIAIMLRESLRHLSVDYLTDIDTDDAYQTTSLIGESVVNTEAHYPINIESTITWNREKYICKRIKENEAAIPQTENYELAQVFKESIGKAEAFLPVLCYFPAQRGKLKRNNNDSINLSMGEPQRIQGYAGAFSGAQSLDKIQQWCVQMEFAEYQKKGRIKEYATFQSIVSFFCSIIDKKSTNPKIYYSSTKGSIVYFDGTEEKSIYQLSDGYQAALCMIIELAYRAVLLNPSVTDLAKNAEGIVLIDEIEMHLHPGWQWIILDAIQQTFPKMQFIVATHSPIILSSAKHATLYLMKSPNEVVKLHNAYGYSVDDVLSLLQGTVYQPEKIMGYYNKIEEILDSGTEDDLQALLAKAKSELKESPDALKGILDFAEINRWVEEA